MYSFIGSLYTFIELFITMLSEVYCKRKPLIIIVFYRLINIATFS